MWFGLYNALLCIIAFFAFPYYGAIMLLTGKYRKSLGPKFGLLPKGAALRIEGSPRIWVHAVSVGEVTAASPIVTSIRSSFPGAAIVLSTSTETGQEMAIKLVSAASAHIYYPLDIPRVVRKVVDWVQPDIFIPVETELWPNTISLLRKRGVPVVLMNGWISERSFRGYKKIRPFMARLLRKISLFCMQDSTYAERIVGLGADTDRVSVIGSFKFDTKPASDVPGWTTIFRGQKAEDRRQRTEDRGQRTEDRGQKTEDRRQNQGESPHASRVTHHESVIIAGSTHRPEEEIVLDAYERLLPDFPSLNLILAPRHPERFGEVEELLRKRGLRYLKRSELKGEGAGDHGPGVVAYGHTPLQHASRITHHGLVVLLDVIGELGAVYGAADIAVMGGSFIDHGGQNPLEPAFWGMPILCGPHMENFPFIGEFYDKGGALQVDEKSLAAGIGRLLSSPEEAASMGKVAKDLYEKSSGAVERAMELLAPYL
ncbi:MAG: 3-deoxy-D-manno-octulosonic acid transferase [Nitrospirales bacterium]|nr:3-deoxy-D-manno-octulosonic acid transferase [Nitrospirales bacterium]